MPFVDTNMFLRYLTRDDPVKAERVKDLLGRAQRGQVTLLITETTIAEVVFILSSPRLYHLSREEIHRLLLPIIALKGLKVPNRGVFVRAFDLYVTTPMDFVDALTIAHMERRHVAEVYSYDEHFDRIQGIKRIEP
jgi:predicted nucleic acid-binding protein